MIVFEPGLFLVSGGVRYGVAFVCVCVGGGVYGLSGFPCAGCPPSPSLKP